MSVEQESASIEAADQEAVCAGCEHPPDEDEELRPVVLNPRLESDDTPDLVVDRTPETIEFDPDDLQSFLDQYTDREVEVVADYIFWMHDGCIESLFDVDVEPVEDGVEVSERGVSSEESSDDDSRERTGYSMSEMVSSWLAVAGISIAVYPAVEGLIPMDIAFILWMIGMIGVLLLGPRKSSRGGR